MIRQSRSAEGSKWSPLLSATEPKLYRPMHFQLLTTTTQYPLAWLKSSSSEKEWKFASFIDLKGDCLVHNGN